MLQVGALIDAVDEAFVSRAVRNAQCVPNPSLRRADYRNNEALVAAFPVAARLMREMDVEDHGGMLSADEFVRGLRLLVDVCANELRLPMLTTMSKNGHKLRKLFKDYDLNHDKQIDLYVQPDSNLRPAYAQLVLPIAAAPC